ncbi:hypothetical protein EDC01DRAFT_782142 [Geopyxis carbonaria]|nr:hypothetical protein EDC01DRAFT_782142 [Geopyxis carbonaria]
MCSSDCFLVLLAILFPPLPVWVKRGICSGDSIINIALCILGFLPGLLHAWYIVAKYPDPYDDVQYTRIHDAEAQRSHCQRRQPRGHSGRMVYNVPAPAPEGGYGSFAPQQQAAAPGPSNGGGEAEPPSYASVVKGDNKVQH